MIEAQETGLALLNAAPRAHGTVVHQFALQTLGKIQAQAAAIAAHNKDGVTAMDTGLIHINASAKAPAALAQHNALAHPTNHATQDAIGKLQALIMMGMVLTANAVIRNVIMPTELQIQQKHLRKQAALILLTMTATAEEIARTLIAQAAQDLGE